MVPAGEEARDYSTLQSVARRRLSEMGLSPPLCLDVLRVALERERETTIALVPTDELPIGAAFGVTGRQDAVEVVLYETRTAPSHQDLIVLHEFAHMVLHHPPSAVLHTREEFASFHEIDANAVAEALGKEVIGAVSDPPRRRSRRRWWRPQATVDVEGFTPPVSSASPESNRYARVCEREAETLATILLDWMPDQVGATDVGAPTDPAVERLTDALGLRWGPR